ncbi:ribose-5-phosphate isomerase RpiA [Segnochrobactraceae bacterium EtOH-i3]
MTADELKAEAGRAALGYVTSGMRLGLGTGSTAEAFVRALGEKVAAGFQVVGVPTSERTAALAASLGIPLATLEEVPELDLVIDGADEVDPQLRLIKGGGAALLREKIVAAAAKEMLVIADASKLVDRLGRFPLPIEVNRFGLEATRRAILAALAGLGLPEVVAVRHTKDGAEVVTDGGHLIIDARLEAIPDPEALSAALHRIPGVVEHGLFLGYATRVLLAGSDGVKVLNAA